jgi:hypothetical protein
LVFSIPCGGKKNVGQSTGETSLALARLYVMRLYNEGRLAPSSRLKFSEFAKGWWQPGCAYMRSQEERGKTLSASYLATMRGYLLHHVLPFFSDRRLVEISSNSIHRFLAALKAKNLAPSVKGHHIPHPGVTKIPHPIPR